MGDQEDRIAEWRKVSPVPMTAGNRVTFYIGGKDAFAAMADAIDTTFEDPKGKGYYIYLLGWWLEEKIRLRENDESSRVDRLLKKAFDLGVEVRVILWKNHLKVKDLNTRFLLDWDVVSNKNGNKAQVDLVNSWRRDPKERQIAILDDFTLPKGQVHSKILIVNGSEGRIGFCGGMDIADTRVTRSRLLPGTPMHDVQCKFEGPAVRGLIDVFVQRWVDNPEPNKADLLGRNDTKEQGGDSRPGTEDVAITRTYVTKECVRERSIDEAFQRAIAKASQFIYLEDQFLTNPRACLLLKSAVPRLAASKGHLTILVSHPEFLPRLPSNRYGMNFLRANRNAFIDFLTDGKWLAQWDRRGATPDRVADWAKGQTIRIFERMGDDFSTDGPGAYVHAKVWIFDDYLAMVGSANCDNRGWFHDHEVTALICDHSPAAFDDSPKGAWSFAQNLRAELWARHLNVDVRKVLDGTKSKNEWFRIGSRVRIYDPRTPEDYQPFENPNPETPKSRIAWKDFPEEYRREWDPQPPENVWKMCPKDRGKQ